jgi:hypothetical protein
VPRTTRDSSRRVLVFGYRALTSYGGPFQAASPNEHLSHSMWDVPQPRGACSPVWANPRSLAATDGITVVFSSSGYLDVSVPPVCLSRTYGFSSLYAPSLARGFPHSDIRGSLPAYGSPRLFVVRHVLLRLLAPRHPPCALRSLSLAQRYALCGTSVRACATSTLGVLLRFTVLSVPCSFLASLLSLSGFQGAK